MKVTIKQRPENPIPVEIMAEAVVEIASAMKVLERTRLSRKAVIALVHDSSGVPKRVIADVLDHLQNLEKNWLKK